MLAVEWPRHGLRGRVRSRRKRCVRAAARAFAGSGLGSVDRCGRCVLPMRRRLGRPAGRAATTPWIPAFAGMRLCKRSATSHHRRSRTATAKGIHSRRRPAPARAASNWEGLQARCSSLRPRESGPGRPTERIAPSPDSPRHHRHGAGRPSAATSPGTGTTPVGRALPARFHAAIMQEPIAAVQRPPYPQTAVTARQGPPFTLPDAHSGCSASLGSRHEAAIRMKGQVRHNVPLSAHGHA